MLSGNAEAGARLRSCPRAGLIVTVQGGEDMAELLDILQNELDEESIRELGQRVGSDEATTQRAVSMLLPVLIAGLSHNVEQPGGSEALTEALRKDHDGSLLDQLGGLLRGEGSLGSVLGGLLGGRPAQATASGGGSVSARQVDGAGILQHLLGTQQGAVAESVSRASGMEANKVSQLMMLLAPIVMAALGRVRRDENLEAGGVADLIRRESRNIEQQAPETRAAGGLAGWLDSNRDGKVNFSDNIAKVGMALGSALLIGIGRRRKG
jgi:hypothetical protein